MAFLYANPFHIDKLNYNKSTIHWQQSARSQIYTKIYISYINNTFSVGYHEKKNKIKQSVIKQVMAISVFHLRKKQQTYKIRII